MRRAPIVLIATSLAAFTATLDNTVVAVALRDMQQDLGAGVTGLQSLVTAYTVTLAALLLAGGALVDVLGARRVLLVGLFAFGLASAGCATADTVSALVGWRVAQGAGAALLLPGALAVLAATYPDPRRLRKAVGIWSAAGGLALVAGPVIGGWLVALHGWPWIFWVNVPLSAAVAAVIVTAPDGPARESRRLDVRGTVLTSISLGAATVAVVVAGRHGLTWSVLIWAAAAMAAGGWLVHVERRCPDPVLPVALVRDRAVLGGLAAGFAAAVAVFLLLVFLSLFLELVQELDARQTGRLLLALPASLVVTVLLTSHWRAVVAPVVSGLLLAAVGLAGLGLALSAEVAHGTVVGWLVLIGVGVGLTTAPVVAAVLHAAGALRGGLAAGAVTVARELGGVVAVAGLGALAVARLADRLTGTLVSAGVSPQGRPALLDALLSAQTGQARRLLVEDLGAVRALQVAQALSDSATASFVASTRAVLLAGAALLVVVAVVSGRLLRRA